MNDADVAELRRRKLPIPVEGVAAAMLVPTFHQARGEHEHEALDILAPRGTAVIAVEDGRIAKLFTSVRGGLTIYLFDPVRASTATTTRTSISTRTDCTTGRTSSAAR